MAGNIYSLSDGVTKATELRAVGKSVVAVSGTFDLLHDGHRALIAEARTQGDALFVLVNSDVSVKKYKGPTRPIIAEDERARLVSELEGVTGVIVFDDINPISVLEKLRPDVYVNGSDWGAECIEKPTVESYGGKIHVVTRGAVSTESTSAILKRMPDFVEANPVRAAFVDRDGVIIEDIGYLHEVEKVRILPHVVEGLKKIQDAGYLILVVTNQSGVGRGMFPISDMHAVNLHIVEELAKSGVMVTKVYYCAHAPEDNCDCRKPKVGLLLQAVQEYGVVLEKSFMIGDKSSDVECGRFANAKAILIDNGLYPYKSQIKPHFIAKDLVEASGYMNVESKNA